MRNICSELVRVVAFDFPDAEFIFVNDGSLDKTAARLDEIAGLFSCCRVYHLAENQGQSAALLVGLSQTLAPIIVTMDGDGQNDPNDIKRLIKRLEQGDMVVGVRRARQDPWMRPKIARLANVIRSRWLGDGVSDAGCGLKVFRREVADSFIPIRTLTSFMPALALAAGYRVVEEKVYRRRRRSGTSKYTVSGFLFLPIIDFIGLRWFGARRRRVRPKKTTILGRVSVGEARYRRSLNHWWKNAACTSAVCLIVLGFFFNRGSFHAVAAHRIGLDQAEKIALSKVPEGKVGVEEFHTLGSRPAWAIDVRVPHSTEIREIEIDARDQSRPGHANGDG